MRSDDDRNALLHEASRRAGAYLRSLPTRRVAPSSEALARLNELGGPLSTAGVPALDVLALLDDVGSHATVASAGGRYFGLVIGGALPVTVAASWLATAWDQNTVLRSVSPVGAALEEIALAWMGELFGLPEGFEGACVSGASMATMAALAAARHALLSRAGWDVEARGLFGAPELKVVVSAEMHVTVLKALSLLGLGRERLVKVPVDDQGRMRSDRLPPMDGRTIVCIQAGNVNTGAFDPAADICSTARESGAWVHVDGAFGLWAATAPSLKHLTEGFDQADSWATDGHKWLNVPYDSGIVFVRSAGDLRAAMSADAAYLAAGVDGDREPSHFAPELSRRARGVEIWAALKTLGRDGLARQIQAGCDHARAFAHGLVAMGYEVLNDVVLNQVLVSFGSEPLTRRTIEILQEDGVCWCGGTVWQGHTAMRISVSSWATTAEDVQASLAAIDRAARRAVADRTVLAETL